MTAPEGRCVCVSEDFKGEHHLKCPLYVRPVVIDVPGCTCETRTQEQLDRADVCNACVSYFDLRTMSG